MAIYICKGTTKNANSIPIVYEAVADSRTQAEEMSKIQVRQDHPSVDVELLQIECLEKNE